MRSKTLRNRGIDPTFLRKNTIVQQICKEFKAQEVQIEVEVSHCVKECLKHLTGKPKAFSVRNWMFPFIYANMTSSWNENREKTAETVYQEFMAYNKAQTETFKVEVTCKPNTLAMCFDSNHFSSCGAVGRSNDYLADDVITSKNSFAIIMRDRSGKVQARQFMILDKKRSILKHFSHYGNDKVNSVMKNIIRSIANQYNLICSYEGALF